MIIMMMVMMMMMMMMIVMKVIKIMGMIKVTMKNEIDHNNKNCE